MEEKNTPALLYKFLRTSSGRLLSSGTVRFSQFAALNDPTEFLTTTSEEDLQDKIVSLFEEVAAEIDVDTYIAQQIEEFFQSSPAFSMLPPAIRAQLEPVARKYLANQIPSVKTQYAQLMQTAKPMAATKLAQLLVNGIRKGEVVIFSSTAVWNSAPMWAHYADGFQGFVVGFEPRIMFSSKETWLTPRKVEYVDNVPEIIVKASSKIDILTKKISSWSYEKEWRYTHLSPKGDAPLDANGEKIHLFPFNPAAVKEVVFGSSSSEQLKTQIRKSLTGLGATPTYFQLSTGSGALGLDRMICEV